MRTSFLALVAAGALALPARAESFADRLEIGLAPELTLVGLTYGARPELQYKLGPVGTHRLRFAPGFLIGPEYGYVPVSLSWRAVWRQDATVRPMFGAGFEFQSRFVTDAPAANGFGVALEGGVLFGINEQLALGLAAGLDVTFIGQPGVGLIVRGLATWAL